MKVMEFVRNAFGKVAMISTVAIIAMTLAATPGIAAEDDIPCKRPGPGEPSIQLLPTIGLGVLRDRFCDNGLHDSSISKPRLAIYNKANATLNVLIYGEDGTKYDLKLPQGANDQWAISPGTYRSELIIPGFPSMAGAPMKIADGHSYVWVIERSEL